MKRQRRLPFSLFLASILLAIAVLLLLSLYAARLEQQTMQQRQLVLSQALERAIINCYSLEGSYPPDVSYLEAHYGLTYDAESFYIDYRPIGSNLRPDFHVIALRKAGAP